MRPIRTRTIIIFLVVAIALGGAIGPARAAITLPTDQTECEAMGGIWVPSGAGNLCQLPVSVDPGICPGSSIFYVQLSYDTLTCGGYSSALIGSSGADCILDHGLWQGDSDGLDGKCVYPAGTPDALAACGPGLDLVFRLENGVTQLPGACQTLTFSTARVPGFGRFGMAVNGVSEGGILSLSGGKNGSVTFDAGTCSGKCTLGPNLPGGAHADLPDDAVAWLYFKSVDENGDPGTGTYTVCFNVGDLTSPVIYRYVSGAWVVVASTISGGQICFSASGDGAFALGGA